jgi:hypothetical protein
MNYLPTYSSKYVILNILFYSSCMLLIQPLKWKKIIQPQISIKK